ncbi:MAG: hypothetical protein ACRDLV_03270 [Solirubrobacteraceae bacterium]
MPGPSLLDAHLAEIDRRLRAIQSGLAPDAGVPAGRSEAVPAERSAVVEEPVAVSAGPFDDTGALARFERALATLPGVSRVTLREFQGADRAVFEVLIGEPIS